MIDEFQGICPKCGTDNLDYTDVKSDDNGIHYPWECLDCGAKGKECYYIEFTEHEVDEEN